MKITGGRNYIKFDFENGYAVKAEGEMLVDRKFVVYTNTIKYWEPPFESKEVSKEQIESLKQEVAANMNSDTVQIIFE